MRWRQGAAFAAFARVFEAALGGVAASWTGLSGAGGAHDDVGTSPRLRQRSVKRMARLLVDRARGYALVGLVAGARTAARALLFYLRRILLP